MVDLRRRFGRLLAAHRRRLDMTQDELAEAANVSEDMISKLETGASGARFPMIEKLATALMIDPAELFTSDVPNGRLNRGSYARITVQLANLTETDLGWVEQLIELALNRPAASIKRGEKGTPRG